MSDRATGVSVIGIDQGSSSTKAVVLGADGAVLGENAWPIRSIVTHDESGELVEHEAEEILSSVQSAISWGIVLSRNAGCHAQGIGLAVQRSGVVAWNADGPVVSRVLSWRDGRTQAVCDRVLANEDTVTWIAHRSGLVPNRFFAASKWALMQRRFSAQSSRVATLDSYLLCQLLGHDRFLTDDSMAARTLLYDLEARGWSPELCAIWGVDATRLPQILPSVSNRGVVPEGIPVLASLGDKEAAAAYLLSGCAHDSSRGEGAVLDLGTLATVTVASGTVPTPVPGIGRGVLCSFEGENGARRIRYEQELRTSIVGDVLDWLAVRVGRRLSFEELSHLWATGVEHDGVMYCAARTGSFGDTAADLGEMQCERVGDVLSAIVSAALEHIVFSLVEVVDAARSAGMLGARSELVVSGGLAHVAGIGQLLADRGQIPLIMRHVGASASARGAANLALGSALGRNSESSQRWHLAKGDRRFDPSPRGLSEGIARRYARWCSLRDSFRS